MTLGRIVDILRQIYADDRSDVGKILIVGFASPEGPLGRNTRLAGARAEVLKEYVNSYLELPDSLYEVANGGEAWGELRDRVEESTFDCRDKMLDIIDHTADLGRPGVGCCAGWTVESLSKNCCARYSPTNVIRDT